MATLVGQSPWAPASSSRRKTHEDAIEKWWDISTQPLVARCMRKHGWKLTFAQRCLKGYRQFMELKTVMNDWKDKQLAAPMAVNIMWEEHILDSVNYTDDCKLLFGNAIGHDPDAASADELTWVNRIKTTKIAFQARFADDMDQDVWNWGEIEYGIDEAMPMDVELHGAHLAAPTTPTGRLPVAQVDRSNDNASPTRYHNATTSHFTKVTPTDMDSDDESTPRKFTRGVSPTRTPSQQPPHRSMSPVRARAHALAARATSLSPKPSTPTANDPITIYLKDKETGDQTYFSLRYRIPFRVMFAVYAERKNIDQEKLQFSFNGQPLTGFETPYSIGMDEGEHIDVLVNKRR
jgi:hypothetical protein